MIDPSLPKDRDHHLRSTEHDLAPAATLPKSGRECDDRPQGTVHAPAPGKIVRVEAPAMLTVAASTPDPVTVGPGGYT
jgi:hypothetical protein